MDVPRKIFVCVDFSPGSDEALQQAHDRAVSTGAKLAVCHIVPNELRSNPIFPHLTRGDALNIPVEIERIAEAASAHITKVTGRPQSDFDLIVDDGTPYAAILTNAEKWLADLIVVGSHGITSAAGVLMGSVTNKVIRYAHCPVLIVRPGAKGGIVAGTDFSDPAFPALKAAADEARRTGAKLTVVHCLDVQWTAASYPAMAFGGAPMNLSAEQILELETSAQERLSSVLKQLNVEGQTRVIQGSAVTGLISAASDLNVGLIVVGTIGRTGLSRVLLGSVAEAVAREAPCSVLIVRLHAT